MSFKLRLREIFSVTMVAVIILAGLCVMSAREAMAREKVATAANRALAEDVSLPNAGIGMIVSNYVGATGESSVDLLSTTALGATYTEYNEYYDSKGKALGKLIVCKTDDSIAVYDRIPGNERVERGDTKMAQVVGRMSKGDVATLVGIAGNWYQIVADSFSGYVNTSFFAVGKDAEALNDSTWVRIAVVNDDELMLTSEPDYNSDLLAFLYSGLWFEVLEEGEEFSRIYVPDVGEGWIESEYADFQTVRRQGISNQASAERAQAIAECVYAADDWAEARRLEEEEEAYYEELAARRASIAPAAADSADVAALRQAIVDYAQQFVGWLPYVSGGNSLESGADCCGFTQAIYREFGYDIPRTTDGQMYGGTAVSLDDIRPGDIVYYGGHVALYIGGDTVVHEPVPGDVCSYQSMYMMPIYGVVRYIE